MSFLLKANIKLGKWQLMEQNRLQEKVLSKCLGKNQVVAEINNSKRKRLPNLLTNLLINHSHKRKKNQSITVVGNEVREEEDGSPNYTIQKNLFKNKIYSNLITSSIILCLFDRTNTYFTRNNQRRKINREAKNQ